MISSIRLQNFRSYRDQSFEFGNGVNIVIGPNASGKTNLLEAVLVLCRGSSYRGRDSELLKVGAAWSRLDGNFGGSTRTLKIEAHENSLAKTYLFDDKVYKRLGLDKTVPVVYFEPNSLQVISRGPDQRRDYFDDLLERSQIEYKRTLNAYKRTLAQRNNLLKQPQSKARSQLFAWDVRLSELGAKIAENRQHLTNAINQTLSDTYSQIAGHKTAVRLDYEAQFRIGSYASQMVAKLEEGSARDFERGFTGYGPHREDFSAYINSQPASSAASRGENRSLMLALKIFELELIEKNRGEPAIFLLDDVFSELDGRRRHALVDFLGERQTIITTTDADTVTGYFATGKQNLISLL